ncbi:hypothetical protein A4A49_32602 [Nicotiana attenuata]|uniref:Uncharacterized protein n=1 Tax=Nicotiana attenuata TaxID=49451 RepID=A0A1J6JAN9_NICAT|nr:hypothetical protein A4A49_32602 [Nicotiana attenuata]
MSKFLQLNTYFIHEPKLQTSGTWRFSFVCKVNFHVNALSIDLRKIAIILRIFLSYLPKTKVHAFSFKWQSLSCGAEIIFLAEVNCCHCQVSEDNKVRGEDQSMEVRNFLLTLIG